MFKIDMHCHTKAGSIDAKLPIEDYIRLLKEKGFNGMLITDHTSYKGYRYWQQFCTPDKDGFIVLQGVEYDTRNAGHFIVIMPDNINLKVLQIRGMSIRQLEKIVHHFGGIYGPAHPFGLRSSSAMFCHAIRKHPELIETFDFVEGFNTCERKHANEAAEIMAQKYRKPCVAGSDAHRAEYVGTAYTIFDMPIKNNNDLIKAIKEGHIADFGGTERKFLRKHKRRDSLAAVWGFKTYNRSLGFLFSPYRYYKLKRTPISRGSRR